MDHNSPTKPKISVSPFKKKFASLWFKQRDLIKTVFYLPQNQ